jgi:ABC-type uncharacterized transport system auxiliary subunit
MRRRTLLALPALLVGCSILPDRPNVPVRRFALAPRRPQNRTAPRGAPVLLLRSLRAVPGLQEFGLRRVLPGGGYAIAPYDEWVAPPADLAEAALRAWLQDSGLFSAVVPPGSRADSSLVIEAQLTRLEAAPSQGEARAGLSGILLREEGRATRVLLPFEVSGRAPLPGNADAPAEAAAMEAALGEAFARLEEVLARRPR